MKTVATVASNPVDIHIECRSRAFSLHRPTLSRCQKTKEQGTETTVHITYDLTAKSYKRRELISVGSQMLPELGLVWLFL